MPKSLIMDALKRLQSGDAHNAEPPAEETCGCAGVSGDIWDRLDAAVSALDSEVGAAHADLAAQVAHIEQRFVAHAADASRAVSATEMELQEARKRLDALAQELGQRDAALGVATQGIAQLNQQMEALSGEIQRLRTEAEDRVASDRTAELESLLAAERARAALLEGRLRDGHAEAADARELAERLRRRLDATVEEHQEAVGVLRAEIETLRRANASLNTSAKQQASAAVVFDGRDAEGNRRRIGEILIHAGVLEEGQLDAALMEQSGTPQRRIGSILVERGYVGDEPVARALASQLGLPFIHLTPESVDAVAPRLIHGQFARRRQCIPIAMTGDRVVLAMVNPQDLVALDDVKLASGRDVSAVVATASDIAAAVSRCYGAN